MRFVLGVECCSRQNLVMAEIRIPANELNTFDLPKVCVMTGATDATVEFRKVKFQWYPPWVNALILINIIVLAIVARILTKVAKGELAFSEAAWKRWRMWKLGLVFSLLGMIGGIVVGIILLASNSSIGGVLVLVSFVQGIAVIILARRAGPAVVSIKDEVLILKVPSDEAARQYQQHLHTRATG